MTPEQQKTFDEHVSLALKVASFWMTRSSNRAALKTPQIFENAALVGLWRAVLTYQEGRGKKFSSYAIDCVRWAMCSARDFERRGFKGLTITSMDSAPVEGAEPKHFLQAPDNSSSSTSAQHIEWVLYASKLAIASIPEGRLREVIILRYMEKLTQRQIGKRFGVSGARVEQLIREALSIARKRLKKKGLEI
ncbi:MAG TPA: sigma-70 family RNA polymerase sigma factor [Planctomycetota bacterium]|nr:sigma-70 family RNA polymerase sigma factor [Planctomycetota bacterium]